jgi:hypothetical protein
MGYNLNPFKRVFAKSRLINQHFREHLGFFQANSVCLWSWCSSELDPSFEDGSVNPGEEAKGTEPELLAKFAHNIGDVNELQV